MFYLLYVENLLHKYCNSLIDDVFLIMNSKNFNFLIFIKI